MGVLAARTAARKVLRSGIEVKLGKDQQGRTTHDVRIGKYHHFSQNQPASTEVVEYDRRND